jgi:hypothetical protein
MSKLDLSNARPGDWVKDSWDNLGVIKSCNASKDPRYPVTITFSDATKTFTYEGLYNLHNPESKSNLVKHMSQSEWPTARTDTPKSEDADGEGNIQALNARGYWVFLTLSSYLYCKSSYQGWAHSPNWKKQSPKELLIEQLQEGLNNYETAGALRPILAQTIKYLETVRE